MRKLKLKSYVVPTLSFLLIFVFFASALIVKSGKSTSLTSNRYVNESILENDIPVVKQTTQLIKPYVSPNVEIGKYYYNYNDSEENQKKAIIKYDDTYMQNSGIDLVGEDIFEVISVLDGKVISVADDETLGKVVKIEHANGYISVYQSLSEVDVEKDNYVSQGQVIGKSGTNKIDKSLKNHLHFELYLNSQMVNPLDYLDKSINN